jgi:hypothetical protein
MGYHLSRIFRRPAAIRRGVDVQLDAAAAELLEVVGVDLDLVGQRCMRRDGQRDERGKN